MDSVCFYRQSEDTYLFLETGQEQIDTAEWFFSPFDKWEEPLSEFNFNPKAIETEDGREYHLVLLPIKDISALWDHHVAKRNQDMLYIFRTDVLVVPVQDQSYERMGLPDFVGAVPMSDYIDD